MSFVEIFNSISQEKIKKAIYSATKDQVERVLRKKSWTIEDFPCLVSPAAEEFIENMAAISRKITFLRFGKIIRLYAPLYISNSCVNACKYCGFNVNNKFPRITLSMNEVLKEAEEIRNKGIGHLLLVSGEDKKAVPVEYLCEIVKRVRDMFYAVSIEVYPMDTEDYKKLANAGVTGIAVYQETYNRERYKELHKGPKANFEYRLETPERAAKAGFRELGLGALIGLSDFRVDLTMVALHAKYLMKNYWKSQVAISFPRLRDAEGHFKSYEIVTDKQLAQVIFALRMVLNDVEIVLSTRENISFRDGMAGLGVTRMSAGSKTNPGGYAVCDETLKQFEIADERTPHEISRMIEEKGLEPVLKDFDRHFLFE